MTPDAPAAALVVAATKAEARYVPDGLPLLITGIGKVAAATSVSSWLATNRPLPADFEMVNIGTAGALRSGLSGLYLPGAVINHDMSSELLRSVGITITDQLALTGGDDRVVLATGDTFVVDPVLRAALGERASLVDMEGFAIAWAARHHDVTLRLVKHVSDNADSTALDWPLAVDASARALGDWLLGWLGESRS